MNPVNMKSAKEADKVLQKRILLVDDEPIVRESIGMLLSLDKHTVVETTNGDEALSLFARGQFDLVVTDFQIPSMTGSELAARIKQLASPSFGAWPWPSERRVQEVHTRCTPYAHAGKGCAALVHPVCTSCTQPEEPKRRLGLRCCWPPRSQSS
jgi:CheY-like chemotaxis protein